MSHLFLKSFALLITIFLLNSCVRKEFRSANSGNTISDYKEFLSAHPENSKYRILALHKVDSLLFHKARYEGTMLALHGYKRSVFANNYKDSADFLMDSIDFNYATITNKELNFKNYIANGKNREYIDSAKLLLETAIFEEAYQSASLKKMNRYLSLYPTGIYSKKVESKIINVSDSIAYYNAKKTLIPRKLRDYISEFPSGRYVDSANAELSRLDTLMYQSIPEAGYWGTPFEKLNHYLLHFPNGKFKSLAQKRLEPFEEKVRDYTLARKDLSDPDLYVRSYVTHTLSTADGKEAIELLLPMLNHSDRGIRMAAIVGLDKIGTANIGTTNPYSKTLADPSRVQKNMDILKYVAPRIYDTDIKIRESALRIFGKMGDSTHVVLIQPLLKDKHSYLREFAFRTIVELGGKEAISCMQTLLYDRNARMRSSAQSALKKLGAPISREKQIKLMLSFKDPIVRKPEYWAEASSMLLKDLHYNGKAEYAISRFLFIGNSEIIPTLINYMNKQSDTLIPVTFLNSGNAQLRDAAKLWAKSRGYKTWTSYNSSSKTLGSWKR